MTPIRYQCQSWQMGIDDSCSSPSWCSSVCTQFQWHIFYSLLMPYWRLLYALLFDSCVQGSVTEYQSSSFQFYHNSGSQWKMLSDKSMVVIRDNKKNVLYLKPTFIDFLREVIVVVVVMVIPGDVFLVQSLVLLAVLAQLRLLGNRAGWGLHGIPGVHHPGG